MHRYLTLTRHLKKRGGIEYNNGNNNHNHNEDELGLFNSLVGTHFKLLISADWNKTIRESYKNVKYLIYLK